MQNELTQFENKVYQVKQFISKMSQQPVKATPVEPTTVIIVQQEERPAETQAKNKAVIACWLLMLLQIFYCFMYGFFYRVNEISIGKTEDFVHTALLFVLIVAGFGLALCSSHKLIWSTLGYNVLITALSIQTYFLVNAFWTKLVIYKQNITNFDSNPNRLYLTASEISTETHATLTQALKCALSCIVAFSFINGRAGILELFFVTITGTIVYQLARQTCLNNFPYQIGSIKIFLFGGVLGLMVSLVLNKLGHEINIVNHFNNYPNRPSIILSLLGTLICWALFPLLTSQIILAQNVATHWARVYSVVLAMSSAALVGIFQGYTKFGFKSVVYSVLGAGVAILSASAYISNPVYAIVFGIASGLFQFMFIAINSKLKARVGPIDPHAYVFVGQGFLGIFYQAINRQIVQTNPNSLVFSWTNAKRPQYILGNGAITIGMALILGFIIGTLFACCPYHEQIDHYTDFTYWTRGDGISNIKVVKNQQTQIYIRENQVNIKEKNAYL